MWREMRKRDWFLVAAAIVAITFLYCVGIDPRDWIDFFRH